MKKRVGNYRWRCFGAGGCHWRSQERSGSNCHRNIWTGWEKILSTGNGRCNLTNYKMEEDCYRCGRKDFPMQVIRGFDVKETLDLFMGLGIVPKDRNGYVYPNSDQAASV